MTDFKTQQEIWKWLVEGGKVVYVDIVLGMKDGQLWNFNLNQGTNASMDNPEDWRKYTEPQYVWFNVYPSDWDLANRLRCGYPNKSEADTAAWEGRVGRIKFKLEARFDD